MSAAAKLKGLDPAGQALPARVQRTWKLQDAFPQIVAVVEAAEKAEDILRQHARGGDLIHGRHVLHDALTALDEALT